MTQTLYSHMNKVKIKKKRDGVYWEVTRSWRVLSSEGFDVAPVGPWLALGTGLLQKNRPGLSVVCLAS
jgi:hypothetical protein